MKRNSQLILRQPKTTSMAMTRAIGFKKRKLDGIF